MNAAQKRQVERLKAQMLEARAEQAQQFNETDIRRMPDALLEYKIAERNGWLIDLGAGPVVPDNILDLVMDALRRRPAERAGMSYEDYMALSDQERRELFPQRGAPVMRPEFRWSDGKEAQ